MLRDYVGLLDDKVNQYEDAHRITLEKLNEYLLKAVLFGHPLLINDGYLLLHEAGRKALTDEDASPLLHLLRNSEGFVSIATRNGGRLDDLPGKAAEQGIGDYPELIRSEFWKKTLRQRLESLSSSSAISWTHWPNKNTDLGFMRLFEEVGEASGALGIPRLRDDEWRSFCANVRRRFKEEQPIGARTAFENSVKECFPARDLRQQLMRLGNEIYHYNQAALLSTDEKPVGVFSIHSRRLGMMRDVRMQQIDRFVPVLPQVFRKLRAIPAEAICKVAREGTSLNNLKQRFLDHIYLRNRGVLEARLTGSVESAAKEYAEALKEEMKDALDDAAPVLVRFLRHPAHNYVTFPACGLVAFAVSELVGGPSLDATALAQAAAAGVATSFDWAARTWTYPLEKEMKLEEKEKSFAALVDEGLVVGPARLDPSAVAKHQEAVPKFS
jgi:hypothetical protein